MRIWIQHKNISLTNNSRAILIVIAIFYFFIFYVCDKCVTHFFLPRYTIFLFFLYFFLLFIRSDYHTCNIDGSSKTLYIFFILDLLPAHKKVFLVFFFAFLSIKNVLFTFFFVWSAYQAFMVLVNTHHISFYCTSK